MSAKSLKLEKYKRAWRERYPVHKLPQPALKEAIGKMKPGHHTRVAVHFSR